MDPFWKRFPAIPPPKRWRRIKFNTKEKSSRSILLYLRWPKASDKVSRTLWMTGRYCCLTQSCCKGKESSGGCSLPQNKTCPPSLLITGKIRKHVCASATGEKYLRKTYTALADKLDNLLCRKSVVCVACLEQKGDTCGTHRKTPGTKDYRPHVGVDIFRCRVR